MADGPSLPYIALGPKGEVYVVDDAGRFAYGKLLAVMNGFFAKLVAYDRTGGKWRVEEVLAPYPVNRWMKVLVNTVFNPRVSVQLRWKRISSYEYPELQRALIQAVRRDDDVLTQSISHDRLEQVVSLSDSYDQLVSKLHKYKVA